MTATARILVFDSGVGGLSILQEIRQQYPHCCYFYASDNAAFPYGTKSEDELIERVDKVLHQLEQATQADIIVIACNSASTVALPRIRERFSQPVIGVVPAIKPAAAISESKTIGLLATPGTVKRDYTQALIKEFAEHCHVVSVGSSELVHLAEEKLRANAVNNTADNAVDNTSANTTNNAYDNSSDTKTNTKQLMEIVAPLLKHPTMDTVVLACTHFPLLKEELQSVMPHIKYWVDSGEAIARRTGYWLEKLSIGSSDNDQDIPICAAYFTLKDDYAMSLEGALKRFGIQQVHYI